MVRNIISYISVFMLITSLVNLALSVIVYYVFNDFCIYFSRIRWILSALIVSYLIYSRYLIINE